jgi:hypothetical protein
MKQLLILLAFCPLLVRATDYYVSSSTGMNAAGYGTTPSKPVKTIAYLNATFSVQAGDSVYLKSGDVFQEPLILKFSGNSSAHVVYNIYSGSARAVISGFYTLTGGTRMGTSNVYEFYCPGLTSKTNMLVMDGVMQAMGRWPDTGYRTYQSITSTTITDSTLPSTPNWTGAYLVAHCEHYIIDTVLITNQASGGVVTVDDAFSATNVSRGNGYFMENDPRTLQMSTVTTGRWYNNYTKDSMEVYLPGGLGSHVLQVPILDSLCWFNFNNYNDVYNIDFEGSNEYTVLLNFATGLTMNNCLFRYGAGNCFQFNECPSTNLINDTLNYFQNNGALITGSTSLHCLVSNVQVNHCGLIPGMGQRSGGNGNASYTGWYWALGYNTFQGMTILNSGYSGFCFGGDSLTINDCVVDTFCVTKIDGGGFYTNDLSFISYTYGRKLTNCLALYGQNLTSGVPRDTSDASFGFYLDSHAQQVRLSGCTGAYNTSGGLFVHGSKDTSYGNNYYGNGWTQRIIEEYPGIPISGLILKKDQLSTTSSGQVLSVFTTPGTDLTSFGTVDSNYFAKTDTMDFYYKYSTFSAQTVSFPTWQRLTGYDAHSTFMSVPTTFVYNTTGSSAAETFPMSNLAGSGSTGSVTVPAFSSLILYLLTP